MLTVVDMFISDLADLVVHERAWNFFHHCT